MIIAIDGPAGSGKSTIAKILARRLGLVFLNTGSFYRALTLAWLRHNGGAGDGSGSGISLPLDEDAVIAFARSVDFAYRDGHIWLGQEDVEPFVRSDAVEALVAPLSGIVEVRHIVNHKIREVARATGVVCEGRDMTTVVFPDAEHKFYLDASVEARAKRRFEQGTSGLGFDEICRSIAERDEVDRNKKEGSLKIAPDAFYIDTSDLTIDAVCEIIVSKIHL